MKRKHYCIDCNKILSGYRAKRCNSCAGIKREENLDLRKQVSLKLSKNYQKICLECNKPYIHKNLHSKYCSRSCATKVAGRAKKPGNGGLRDGGGYSKLLVYNSSIAGILKLNKEEIEIAKVLDNLKLNWKRNYKGFSYIDLENKQRKYYPDFYIKNFNYYLEYKGWVTNEMNHKMKDSLKRNDFKLLIIYGNSKRYRNLGLNVGVLKENNNLLLEKLSN